MPRRRRVQRHASQLFRMPCQGVADSRHPDAPESPRYQRSLRDLPYQHGHFHRCPLQSWQCWPRLMRNMPQRTNCHRETVQPQQRPEGTDSCERCHRTMAWIPSRYDHAGVVPGTCATQCHNGSLATGRPASHSTVLKATSSCDACHRFTAWFPTFYNHAAVAPGSCTTCHNGSTASGRTSSHAGLGALWSCDQCHSTLAWLPARYNHIGTAPGSCSTCHNGSSAAGRPANHTGAKALLACDGCHNTSAWLPAGYSHIGVAPGGCLTCHAAQRPTSHSARGYIASCDSCHSIGPSWVFNHALQQGKHTCNSCHSKHHDSTPCDYCHTVNGWGG